MHWIDWLVLGGFFIYTIWDGMKQSSGHRDIDSMVLAGRSMPWWAAGLSVMATHASAVTFISTTGLSFMEDMRFLQVYLGLPIAMVILSVTLVPLYYRLRVYTIYQALEDRFGLRLRLLTSFVFLLSRGATVGFAIAAPAYVLALVLGTPLSWTICIMGLTATVYTMFGGIGGVIRTDMKQMVLMLLGLVFCIFWVIRGFPEQLSVNEGMELAGMLGKLETIDLDFDIGEKYNIWSGLIAATFLMLSYFGADQPQVQRVLTAKSLTDARSSLLMSAIFKIPMQFVILLFGVLLYVFYVYADRPLLFLPQTQQESSISQDYEADFEVLHAQRKYWANRCVEEKGWACDEFREKEWQINRLRDKILLELETESGERRDDTNYVFPYFILSELPAGMVGLIIAAILAAALSSIDSVLNSLAATSVIDWLQRLQREKKSDAYYLRATRWATAFWGIIATVSALLFGETEAIIELVNRLGSYVYGPILGVFVLLWLKRADQHSTFWGFLIGMGCVFFLGGLQTNLDGSLINWHFPLSPNPKGFENLIEYLWLNPIGVAIVVGIGWAFGQNKQL